LKKALEIEGDIIIKSDSMYSINVIQGIYKFNTNVKLILTIQDILREVRKTRIVKFSHIKAHAGHIFNERADRLANKGRTR
jgi:ribonuclease HI